MTASSALMTRSDVARRRLVNQRLAGAPFAKPEDVVAWFGAIQSQDYAGAKWAVGQRTRNCTESDVERALDDGKILRTHVLRPTWHFVAAADIGWMLKLSRPRIDAASAYYFRKCELDDRTFGRCNEVLARALEGGKHLERSELARVLERHGIVAAGVRLSYIMMRAELDAVICSGPRSGKQFTYGRFEERAPHAKTMSRDESLVELTRRYFASRGPSLGKDFAWWSGLTIADAKAGIEMSRPHLTSEIAGGKTYWRATSGARAQAGKPTIHLLPSYDEYLVAYKERDVAADAPRLEGLGSREGILDQNLIISKGRVIGAWSRTIVRKSVTVETRLLRPLDEPEANALRHAVERLGCFLGMPARWRRMAKARR